MYCVEAQLAFLTYSREDMVAMLPWVVADLVARAVAHDMLPRLCVVTWPQTSSPVHAQITAYTETPRARRIVETVYPDALTWTPSELEDYIKSADGEWRLASRIFRDLLEYLIECANATTSPNTPSPTSTTPSDS